MSARMYICLFFIISSPICLGLRDLSGAWSCGAGRYTVASTPQNAVWAATCTASCATWAAATITVLNDEEGLCRIVFTDQGGRNHSGQINDQSSSILWSDESVWEKAVPPPPLKYEVDVVIVPHTHDDAGWQRTFEGYYDVEVAPILANVVAWLSEPGHPERRFIVVETSFLQRWWLDQNETTRAAFSSLVESNRLELVGSGWTMHDEESTNPYSTATNMEYGMSWVHATFGRRSRFLWQIDPSGHSLLTPTLGAMLGFDAVVIDRVPDPVRQAFRRNGSLQFVWTPVTTAAVAPTAILATIMDSFYCTVGLAGSTPAEQAASFYNDILRRAENSYLPDSSGRITILWPWGCDFAFQHMSDFDLIPSILAVMAANASAFPNVTARMGTLSEYFDTLHAQGIAFPTQGKRDFHPYRWCFEPENPAGWCTNLPTTPDPAYWRTGMYTSKVALKGLSRVLDASAHAADGMYALSSIAGGAAGGTGASPALRGGGSMGSAKSAALPASWLPAVGAARSTASLMTHHDAITGTAYETCSLGPPYTQCDCYSDYMARMGAAVAGAEAMQGQAKGALLARAAGSPPVFGNATAASAGLNASSVLVLAVGNPLGWARREVVRTPLLAGGAAAVVTDLRSGAAVAAQIVLDSARGSTSLFFLADVPPLSVVAYAVAVTPGTPPPPAQPNAGAPFALSNGAVSLQFDAGGRLAAWANTTSGEALPLTQDFLYFEEVQAGSNLIGGTVYGFEPVSQAPAVLGPAGALPRVTIDAAGPLVWQATQVITPFLVNSLRLFAPAAGLFPPPASPGLAYADALPAGDAMEFQTRLGPLPSAGLGGGSYGAAFTAGAGCAAPGAQPANEAALTTDASGFQTLRRPAHNASAYVQSQVYPAWPGWDYAFGPCDGSAGGVGTLAAAGMRPMGVALTGNSVWQMQHRRILNALDPRGNDSAVADEPALLSVAGAGADAGAFRARRQVHARLLAHPLTLHGALYDSAAAYAAVGTAAWSPPWLTFSLPPGVLLHSLLSRDAWYPPAPASTQSSSAPAPAPPSPAALSSAGADIAARFQLLPYAAPANFTIEDWFGAPLAAVREVTIDLNADKAAADAARLVWQTQGGSGTSRSPNPRAGHPGYRSNSNKTVVYMDAEYVRSYILTPA